MVAVIWIDQALDDLNNIADYIAQDSIKYASITVDKLFKRAEVLATYPRIGRIVPDHLRNYQWEPG